MEKINNGCGRIKKSNSKEAEEKTRKKLKEDQIKVFIENRIVSLLMDFRFKDKMAIPDLLELADMEGLRTIIERFSDEVTPLHQRLRRILESV